MAQLEYARNLIPAQERSQFVAKASCLPMGIASADEQSASSKDGFEIATIGRLSRKKGIDCLIAAAEELAAFGIRPRIGIAGDGEDRAELEAMVRTSDVTFTGFLGGTDKDAFLASSQRFAFPSKASGSDVEGMPVALLEALARGKPVLASRDTNIELLPEWDQIRNLTVLVPDPTDTEKLSSALRELLAICPPRTKDAASPIARYCWKNLIHEYLKPILNSLDR